MTVVYKTDMAVPIVEHTEISVGEIILMIIQITVEQIMTTLTIIEGLMKI